MSTTRQQILAQREAYMTGIETMYRRMRTLAPRTPHSEVRPWSGVAAQWEMEAARLFPMPQVTRPCLAVSGQAEYRVVNGVLEYRYCGTSHQIGRNWRTSPHTYKSICDILHLFTHPTEEVEIQ